MHLRIGGYWEYRNFKGNNLLITVKNEHLLSAERLHNYISITFMVAKSVVYRQSCTLSSCCLSMYRSTFIPQYKFCICLYTYSSEWYSKTYCSYRKLWPSTDVKCQQSVLGPLLILYHHDQCTLNGCISTC